MFNHELCITFGRCQELCDLCFLDVFFSDFDAVECFLTFLTFVFCIMFQHMTLHVNAFWCYIIACVPILSALSSGANFTTIMSSWLVKTSCRFESLVPWLWKSCYTQVHTLFIGNSWTSYSSLWISQKVLHRSLYWFTLVFYLALSFSWWRLSFSYISYI